MTTADFDNDDKRICHNCVGDTYLKSDIKLNGKRKKCSYCDSVAKCYTLEHISDVTEKAFLEHYERTLDQMDEWEYRRHNDSESDYVWYRDGESVTSLLMDCMDIESEIAVDISEVLERRYYDMDAAQMGEETEFDSEALYERKGVSANAWHIEWDKFEAILKSKSRYFNQQVSNYLNNIFENLEDYSTYDRKGLITSIGPGYEISKLFRARAFQSEDQLLDAISYPDLLLGTPSSENARAGRMNASGISVFYGATKPVVALAEVRPPVGSHVAIAEFHIIRSLRLLDLTRLERIVTKGSIFDPTYISRLQKDAFLRHMTEMMIKPVMPDHETFEYLSTQVIADYLATSYDGIIFPSVQVDDKASNIVLFNSAARVENVITPKGTEIQSFNRVYDGDEEYTSYNVTEFRPLRFKESKRNQEKFSYGGNTRFRSFTEKTTFEDDRIPALRVDANNIIVNIIKAIDFKTDQYPVSRTVSKPYTWSKKLDIPDL